MRRRLALSAVKFEDFFVPYTTTLSLNWPLPSDCVLITVPSARPDEPPNVLMNPAFEHHLRRLENWSLGADFQRIFPQLVDDSVTIHNR